MASNNKQEKARYSDEELEEFKAIILEKLEDTKHDYESNKKFLSNDDNGTEDTGHSTNPIEDSQIFYSKEEALMLMARQQRFISNLTSALSRIENKTYGICKVSGKLISKNRLRAVPHTTQGIEAKKNK